MLFFKIKIHAIKAATSSRPSSSINKIKSGNMCDDLISIIWMLTMYKYYKNFWWLPFSEVSSNTGRDEGGFRGSLRASTAAGRIRRIRDTFPFRECQQRWRELSLQVRYYFITPMLSIPSDTLLCGSCKTFHFQGKVNFIHFKL